MRDFIVTNLNSGIIITFVIEILSGRVVSSIGLERLLHTQEVKSSNLLLPTNINTKNNSVNSLNKFYLP